MTDVYTKNFFSNDVEVVSAVVPAAGGDILVPIPFEGRLAWCQTSVVVAIGSAGNATLSLEKDVAGGTSLGTATIAASSTVGTEDTVTLTTMSSTVGPEDFHFDNQDICLAVTGSASAGVCNVFLVFEPWVGI